MGTLTTLAEIADVIGSAATSRPRTLIGIAGPPGAGKTTVGTELVALLGAGAQLVSMDGFHLPQTRLVELGRRDRMGAPDTFDVDGFVRLLEALRGSSGEVRAPGFDREIEEATPESVVIGARVTTVVVEGNYLLLASGGWERVSPLLDLTLFVQVDRGIRISRLIERHRRYGKSTADATAWALGPDDANARLIEETAARADHIVRLLTS